MTRHHTTIGESERWLSVIAGGMLALSSLRRRDLGVGTFFALGGVALIYRGLAGHDGFFRAVGGVVEAELERDRPGARSQSDDETDDEVSEAAKESFPASDPPSWTPTKGPDVEDVEEEVEEEAEEREAESGER